ncbi:MAG: sigma-70 family RNA polymerase sigma factor [Phycisphaerales bacterium]|nr:sigma-70 family RNA polymerase sigma factor [Phycisphaerales bacterium]MCB9854440.1 sigma-70 family RNA polymerase sigma factor [Phycisphaerales bacterium]
MLLPVVYDELRDLARRYLSTESSAYMMQATALVHEAYLRLSAGDNHQWKNKAQFVGAAAMTIRRILIEHSRRRTRVKRGGAFRRVILDDQIVAGEGPDIDILDLDEALSRLNEFDAQKSRVVELRFFGGLSIDEIADVIGVSPRTVAREWRLAKAWLRREVLAEGGGHE